MTNPLAEIDDELIRQSQRGDRNAFARLLDTIYDLIFRFALKWVDRVSDAEDITQQVCIKLATVIRQFRFESAFTTWLYRVVLNCVRDWQRKTRAHVSDAQIPEIAGSATSIEAEAELQRVLSEVDRLGKGFKETLLLVYGEGFSHAEAAKVLGVKEATVSWRLHQIRKALNMTDPESAGSKEASR